MGTRVGYAESKSSDDTYLPADASLALRVRTALKAFRVLEKTPEDAIAGAMVTAAIDGDRFHRLAAELAQTEIGEALFAERPRLDRPNLDLEALGQLEEGTVGRAFARAFEDASIQPFETPFVVRNDGDYLMCWYRETHDLHHIVTNYDTDLVGEMEVQAFVLGNLGFRHNAFYVLMTALSQPVVRAHWRRLFAAHRRGKATKSLFSVRYDHYFAEQVETLRADLGVPPL